MGSDLINHRRRIDGIDAVIGRIGGIFIALCVMAYVCLQTVLWMDMRGLNHVTLLFNANMAEELINQKRARPRLIDNQELRIGWLSNIGPLKVGFCETIHLFTALTHCFCICKGKRS